MSEEARIVLLTWEAIDQIVDDEWEGMPPALRSAVHSLREYTRIMGRPSKTDYDGTKPLTETAFLHKRRGELVIERDRALDALAEMFRCFSSEGNWPYSPEDAADMMARALNDAKVVLRDLRHSSAFEDELNEPPKEGDPKDENPLQSPPSALGENET